MKKMMMPAMLLLALLIGGTAMAWLAKFGPFAKASQGVEKAVKAEQLAPATPDSRFVTLDRLIVMLRAPEDARSQYLVLDLVFQTDSNREKLVKSQLPLLRSASYRALADYTVEDIRRMEVDQLAGVLQSAYDKIYGSHAAVPFADVQIARQMLE